MSRHRASASRPPAPSGRLGEVPLLDVGALAPLRVCGAPTWYQAWARFPDAPGEHCNATLSFSWDPSKARVALRDDPPPPRRKRRLEPFAQAEVLVAFAGSASAVRAGRLPSS